LYLVALWPIVFSDVHVSIGFGMGAAGIFEAL
jgi:hypothetical protein